MHDVTWIGSSCLRRHRRLRGYRSRTPRDAWPFDATRRRPGQVPGGATAPDLPAVVSDGGHGLRATAGQVDPNLLTRLAGWAEASRAGGSNW